MIIENHTWKNLLLLITGTILSACSTPKYTYYFDTYSPKDLKIEDTRYSPSGSTSDGTEDQFMFPIQKETLTSSTLNEPTIPNNPIPNLSVDSSSQILIAPKKGGLLKKLRVLKNMKADYGATDGDKKKNGSAIVGFILSVSSLLATLLLISSSGYLALLFFAAGVGIVFSAIGLKSEKRGLARAGLWIGIVGFLVLGLVAIANSGLLGGYD